MSSEQHKFEGQGPKIYERRSAGRIGHPLANIILDQVPMQNGWRVLDVACGTGIVTRVAAERVGADSAIHGIDLNADMLAVAKSLEPTGGARIEWHEGQAAELPFEDEQFDLVTCQNGLQFIPDRAAALSEMHRVLIVGGHLAACVWGSIEHNPYSLTKAQVLGRLVGPEREAVERRRTPFALSEASALRALIEGAGFQEVDIQETGWEFNWGNLAEVVTVDSLPDLDREVAEKVVGDVLKKLSVYKAVDGWVIPVRFNLALARK